MAAPCFLLWQIAQELLSERSVLEKSLLRKSRVYLLPPATPHRFWRSGEAQCRTFPTLPFSFLKGREARSPLCPQASLKQTESRCAPKARLPSPTGGRDSSEEARSSFRKIGRAPLSAPKKSPPGAPNFPQRSTEAAQLHLEALPFFGREFGAYEIHLSSK